MRVVTTNLVAAAAVVVLCLLGVVLTLTGPAHRLHDPVHGLQQLDLLYLDQPAPMGARLDLDPTGPTLLVICRDCRPPAVAAHVVVSSDPDVADAYALRRRDGSVGPGYVMIDGAGHVRYRSFDPNLTDHGQEIQILLAGVR